VDIAVDGCGLRRGEYESRQSARQPGHRERGGELDRAESPTALAELDRDLQGEWF